MNDYRIMSGMNAKKESGYLKSALFFCNKLILISILLRWGDSSWQDCLTFNPECCIVYFINYGLFINFQPMMK